MAALTVEPATASSSIYLFAPQISQKMVEPPKGSLSVEHLKVLMVEHLKVLISRAPLPVLSLPVEHLKVLDAYWVVGIGMSE